MKKLLTSGLLLLAAGASAFGFASCNFLDALGYVEDKLPDDSGFIFALTEDQTSYAVTDYVGEGEHVVIPDVHNQLPVTQIASWAFNASETIKSIVIPESITTIGECAFSSCTALESVDIRANVDTIGDSVFGSCVSLQNVVVPDGVQTIGENAFIYCNSLQNVILPESVTAIGTGVFDACERLSHIYYKGTQTDWAQLSIAGNNVELTAATTHYFSAEKPEDDADGEFWYYSPEGAVTNWKLRSEGLKYTLINDEYYQISGYEGRDLDVVIPSKYQGKPVTTIGQSAFSWKYITSVKFPESIVRIKDYAFEYTNGLTSITLPDSLTYLGSYAFSASAIQSVTLPSTLTTIPSCAFYNAKSLTTVEFPDSLTKIEGYAFAYSGLYTVDFNNVQEIENHAFMDCDNLTKVELPDTLTTIGYDAFTDCDSLTSVVVGTGVTSMGYGAFGYTSETKVYYKGSASQFANVNSNISQQVYTYAETQPQGDGLYWHYEFGLITHWKWKTEGLQYNIYGDFVSVSGYEGTDASVYIPSIYEGKPVERIEMYAFEGKTHITNVYLPDGLETIGEDAFRDCTNLTSMVVPDSVLWIGERVFGRCSSLQSLTLPFVGLQANTSGTLGMIFGSFADYNDTKLTAIEQTDGYYYVVPNSLKTVTITGGSIPYGAFQNFHMLETVTLPTGVTNIADKAFEGCSSLTTLNCGALTEIGYSAFGGCNALNSIDLSSVTRIDHYAFNACMSLQDVTFSNHLTSIGDSAFYVCSNLETLTLPSSITAYGTFVFAGCTALESVMVQSTADIAGYMFHNCQNLVNVSLPTDIQTIGAWAFSYCSSLQSINLPSSVATIEEFAFAYCTNLTDMVVPENVSSIGTQVFIECPSLQNLTLPFVGTQSYSSGETFGVIFGQLAQFDGLKYTYIEQSSEYDTNYYVLPNSLKTVTITGGYIPYGAFSGCSMLETVTLTDGVTGLGDYAFYNCTNLQDVSIPDSVTRFGNSAFRECDNLQTLFIPVSVTEMGYIALDCGNLENVYYYGTQQQWYAIEGLEDACNQAATYYYSETRPQTATDCWHFINGNEIEIWEPGTDGILYQEDNGVYRVIGYEGTDTEVYIPARHNNKAVESIQSWAFEGCNAIAKIYIPDGIYYIESNAFKGCSGLLEVFLPQTLVAIYSDAFNGCTALTNSYYRGDVLAWQNVYVANGNGSMSSSLYYYSDVRPTTEGNFWYYDENGAARVWGLGTDGLQYTLSGSTYKVTGYTGTDTEVFVPSTHQGVAVTAIDAYAFNSSNITSIEIGEGILSIGEYAFFNCQDLQTVMMPTSLSSIAMYAFRDCVSLTSFEMPSTVTSISSSIFHGCYNLESLSLEFIGASNKTETDTYQYPLGYLFGTSSYTGGISTVQYYFGSSTTSTTYETYYIPQSLKYVTVRGSRILPYAFRNCSNLLEIYFTDNLQTIGDYAFYGCTGLSEMTIPNSVTTIGKGAFTACKGMTELVIPRSVTSIGAYAFDNCTALEKLTIPFIGNSIKTSTQSYQYPLGYMFGTTSYTNTVETRQFYYGSSTTSTTYTTYYIPSSLKTVTVLGGNILNGAFYSCSTLNTIIFGVDVGNIYNNAFYNVSNLTTICYKGTQSSWSSLRSISYTGNNVLNTATWHYDYGYTTVTYSFDSNGGESFSSVTTDEFITLPTPTKSGYTFEGWYDNANFTGTAYTTTYYSTGDTTLYAKWGSTEDGTSFATAYTLLSSPVTVNITYGGQYVYYKFTPTTTRTYSFYSSGSYDTYVYLYDASQSFLKSDDDSGSGENFKVSYYMYAGSTYYISARMWSSSATGSYTMYIS